MEKITNLLPSRPIVVKKEPRHVSLYHEKARQGVQNTKGSHRTLGLAQETLRGPKQYLKVGEGKHIEDKVRKMNAKIRAEMERSDHEAKERLPKDLLEVRRSATISDFVAINIKKARELHPPEIPLMHFENQRGDEEDLIKAGKWPHYIFKKNYGNLPPYIQKLQRNRLHEITKSRHQEKEEEKSKSPIFLKTEEVDDLLKGLRSNFLGKQRELQKLPVVCETRDQKKKKQHLENQIEEIERNIFILTTFNVRIDS